MENARFAEILTMYTFLIMFSVIKDFLEMG